MIVTLLAIAVFCLLWLLAGLKLALIITILAVLVYLLITYAPRNRV